jgi:dipeptidase E
MSPGRAEAVFVGGGNTFRLLRTLQPEGLLTALRFAVERGARYGGASAGPNLEPAPHYEVR